MSSFSADELPHAATGSSSLKRRCARQYRAFVLPTARPNLDGVTCCGGMMPFAAGG